MRCIHWQLSVSLKFDCHFKVLPSKSRPLNGPGHLERTKEFYSSALASLVARQAHSRLDRISLKMLYSIASQISYCLRSRMFCYYANKAMCSGLKTVTFILQINFLQSFLQCNLCHFELSV